MDIEAIIKALGITKEEIVERAAQKLIDEEIDRDNMENTVLHANEVIQKTVEEVTREEMRKVIAAKLSDEMERILTTELHPVNAWGEREGKPTSLRAVLLEESRNFWNTKVDNNGKPIKEDDRWTPSKTRHQYLLRQMLSEEFTKAMKDNLTGIVSQFKQTLRASATVDLEGHLDALLRTANPKG